MASTKAIIEEARTLIKQNQLEKTVELLLSNIDNSDLNKDIINVAGKLSSLQSRNLSGILSHADFNLEENAIRQNLIDILQMLGQTDNLTPETKHGSPPDSKKDSPMTNQSKDKKKLTQTLLYKPILIGASITIAIVLGVIFYPSPTQDYCSAIKWKRVTAGFDIDFTSRIASELAKATAKDLKQLKEGVGNFNSGIEGIVVSQLNKEYEVSDQLFDDFQNYCAQVSLISDQIKDGIFDEDKEAALKILIDLHRKYAKLSSTSTQSVEIIGNVFDKVTNEPIPHADVSIINSKGRTKTDSSGFFKISIEKLETHAKVFISKKKYLRKTENIHLSNGTLKLGAIYLTPENKEKSTIPSTQPITHARKEVAKEPIKATPPPIQTDSVLISFDATNKIAKERTTDFSKQNNITFPDKPILTLLIQKKFFEGELLKITKALVVNEYEKQYKTQTKRIEQVKKIGERDWLKFLQMIHWHFDSQDEVALKGKVLGKIKSCRCFHVDLEGLENEIFSTLMETIEEKQHCFDFSARMMHASEVELVFRNAQLKIGNIKPEDHVHSIWASLPAPETRDLKEKIQSVSEGYSQQKLNLKTLKAAKGIASNHAYKKSKQYLSVRYRVYEACLEELVKLGDIKELEEEMVDLILEDLTKIAKNKLDELKNDYNYTNFSTEDMIEGVVYELFNSCYLAFDSHE